ncbi:MAG: hypothetical protein FH753_09060 [Firmicutes bacterium]|nr:hypothetical protein [Bacillota bacterium]
MFFNEKWLKEIEKYASKKDYIIKEIIFKRLIIISILIVAFNSYRIYKMEEVLKVSEKFVFLVIPIIGYTLLGLIEFRYEWKVYKILKSNRLKENFNKIKFQHIIIENMLFLFIIVYFVNLDPESFFIGGLNEVLEKFIINLILVGILGAILGLLSWEKVKKTLLTLENKTFE